MTRGILVASVLWIASLSVALPRAEAPQSAAPRPRIERGDPRPLSRRQVLRHLSQPAAEDRRPDARHAGPGQRRRTSRGVGEGDPEGRGRHDAARRRAATGRSRRGRRSSHRSKACSIAPRKRRPNPGRPLVHRLNRAEYANAIRDLLALDVDVSALLPPDDSSAGFDNNADVLGRLAGAARELSHCRRAHQRAGASATRRRRRWASCSASARTRRRIATSTGLPLGTVGGLADSDDAAARRRVSVPGQAVPHQPRHDARARVSASARDLAWTASACTSPRSAATRRSRRRATTRRRPATRWTGGSPCACRSRPVRATIGVAFLEKTHALNTRRLQSYVRSSVGHDRLLGLSAHRRSHPDRAVQADRRRRHAEPPSHLRVPARRRPPRKQPCAQRILTTLARRAYRGDVAPRRRARRCWSSTSAAAATAAASKRHRPGAAAHARQPEVRLPRRARSRGGSRRRGVSAVAISSSRRGCRSSCGAAFPTTSCSTSRARAV